MGAAVATKTVIPTSELKWLMGETFRLAARNGFTFWVSKFLNRGVDVNSRSDTSATALHFAVEAGHEPVVKLLIKKGADVNAKDKDLLTPLHLSSKSSISRILLDNGAKINVTEKGKDTPLHTAAYYERPTELVALLVKRGAKINERNFFGNTPLQLAMRNNSLGVVKILLANGADPRIRNNHGADAITEAKAYGFTSIAKLLAKQ